MSMSLTMRTHHTSSTTPCSFYNPTGSLGPGKSQAQCALAVLLPTGCGSTVMSRSRPTSKTLIQMSLGQRTAQSSDWQRRCKIVFVRTTQWCYVGLLSVFVVVLHQKLTKYTTDFPPKILLKSALSGKIHSTYWPTEKSSVQDSRPCCGLQNIWIQLKHLEAFLSLLPYLNLKCLFLSIAFGPFQLGGSIDVRDVCDAPIPLCNYLK